MKVLARPFPLVAVCDIAQCRGVTNHQVDPLDWRIWRFFNSANSRVTVSREVPIICAISSWVSRSFNRGSGLPASPFLELHSRSSFANFSAAECESPSERTSLQAL